MSPAREPQLSPAGGVGGPPIGDDQRHSAMEHDGHESDFVHSCSPQLQWLPSPTLMAALTSSGQIPGSSGMSKETPTTVTGCIEQMEALSLQLDVGSSDVVPQLAPIRVDARSVSAPRGGRSKKLKPQPNSAGCMSTEKREASTWTRKVVSLGCTTEEAEIPHPTVVDNPHGSLSPVQTSRCLNSVVVPCKG